MAEKVYTYYDLMAARDIAGDTITRIGRENDKVVVVNADLMRSSRTQGFAAAYPNRTFNMGVAEQQMVSFSAGLAREGFIPFCFTFATFISMRACEQVRTDVCYNGLPVRFLGNNAGYSAGTMGATHCALEDVGIMTSIGNMTVVEPGDPLQISKIIEASLTWEGPIYIRMGRETQTPIYHNDYKYEIGKAIIVKDGAEGTFICSGSLVRFALDAANKLKEYLGADIRVIDMHTIKPIDKDAILSAAKTGRIVCAQDGNIIGGLGYHVAAVLMEAGSSCKYKMLGCPDHFVPVATTEYLYRKNEYDVQGLYDHMKKLL
jgi:transketolase